MRGAPSATTARCAPLRVAGFENLESLGALYSRVSSHIFGDWNACGKVMGLGPWASRWATDAQRARPSLVRGGTLEGVGDGALLS